MSTTTRSQSAFAAPSAALSSALVGAFVRPMEAFGLAMAEGSLLRRRLVRPTAYALGLQARSFRSSISFSPPNTPTPARPRVPIKALSVVNTDLQALRSNLAAVKIQVRPKHDPAQSRTPRPDGGRSVVPRPLVNTRSSTPRASPRANPPTLRPASTALHVVVPVRSDRSSPPSSTGALCARRSEGLSVRSKRLSS